MPNAHGEGVTVELLRAYDRPGPRYTSYPTAVEFHEGFDEGSYREHLTLAAADPRAPLSLYLHLPFCEERCTFCGCMVIITKKREVAARYLGYLHREIEMLASRLGGRRSLAQYHWGGGTPTYLSPTQMEELHDVVLRHFDLEPGAEAAIEVDPRVTSLEQVDLLRRMGFNRLSLGVQDFTPEVQAAVNRVQSEEQTRALFERARAMGFSSINVDLIYGLPLQTLASFGRSVDTVIAMRPDRVAVYSFAHVPWIRGNQKGIHEDELPPPELKLGLFVAAREQFLAAGYAPIGMDHFSLPEDELAVAARARTLHRNFMGYTVKSATDSLGVGVSAIGDVAGAFAQNVKKLPRYYAAIDEGRFPVERGYRLDPDDHLRRHVILQLMCNFHLDFADLNRRFQLDAHRYFAREIEEVRRGPMADGFVEMDGASLTLTPTGRLFARNVCMIFDRHLREKAMGGSPVFSRTV
jgi:oxygen-independent coproporphyrinogen-3 oxidase